MLDTQASLYRRLNVEDMMEMMGVTLDLCLILIFVGFS